MQPRAAAPEHRLDTGKENEVVKTMVGLVTMGLMTAATAFGSAVPGNNVVGGGTFEDLSQTVYTADSGQTVTDYTYYKHLGSPRTQAEIDVGTNPVRPWQFHREFDFGRWMPVWGAGSGDYGTQTGISAYDTPRSLWSDSTGWSQQVCTNNISVYPLNSGNHALEGVFFRSWVGQFMEAPVNQVAGTASIDFDYFWNNWQPPATTDAASIFHVFIYGVTEAQLPDWNERWGPGAQSNFDGPNGADVLWTSPNWEEWGWTGPGSDEPGIASQGNQWNSFSTDHPDRATFEITTPYPYYYITVWESVYSEGAQYWWLYGGKPSDQMAIAIDNIEFRLPVPLGDVNLDANVNALDISGFISRLTSGTYQIEADINQDGAVNALDISGFVSCLTGGACGPAGGSSGVVPEPGAAGLMLVGGLALLRRR